MKKILVIVSTKFGYDGITNVVTNYYMYQEHKDLRMDILTINPVDEELKKSMEEHGDSNFVIPYRNQNPIKYFLKLISIIKKGNYQIVHAHGGSCTLAVEMLAARVAGVKIRIAHSHNTASDYSTINNFLRPIFLKNYTVGFACGKEAGEWLYAGKKFEVINNGIDVEKFSYNERSREEFRNKYDLQDKYVIGHIGRFNMQKNHEKLITIYEEISKRRNDAVLVLIGDGELRDQIQNMVKEKQLNVRFVGLSDEIPQWLQAMDVLLFPSLFEGLPVAIIEAQASGLPCVLSDTISPMTAITDLVKFVELKAEDSVWAKEVLNLKIRNREQERELVAEKIREHHFDIRENCKEVLKRYEELICQR